MAAETPTHCPYCALQCGITLVRGPGDGALRVEARDFPTNEGRLCHKGWTAADLLSAPDRLTTPLVRDGKQGELRPASWDEALDRVTDAIRRVQQRDGPDAVAVFGGGGLTNEKAYLLGKFARVALGTATVDYNGRFCMSSAATAALRAFGIDRGLPFPLGDVSDADAVLLVGGNLAETMPPVVAHLARVRERGGALVVVDPRRTATARMADLHLQITPGTDLVLANGLLHLAIRSGLVDEAYVAERTSGFADVRRAVAQYWPERVERITGVPAPRLHEAAALLGSGRRYVLTGRGADQHSTGTDTVAAFVNLALALGLPGRVGSGYGALTGQGNGQGGREHGQKADQLPGYRRIDDPAARRHVAAVWGVDPERLPGPGRSAYRVLDTLGTSEGARAMLLFGSNPAVSAPRSRHVRERLSSLDLLVVADFVRSETCDYADVVLPTAQWAEEEGTLTNLEGRVLRRRRATDPPAGVRTDLAILSGLADRLGFHEGFPAEPQAVFEELSRASAGGPADYSGVDYRRLDQTDDVFWPCADEPTPRLFLDRFPTPDGRARLVAVHHRPVEERLDHDYPVYLTTGRLLQHYQSGAQTRRVPALARAAPAPFVEIHPQLAARLGVQDGEPVRVTSRRGSTTAPARVTDTTRMDTVFMPFHWPGVNDVTNPALDPQSDMPELKLSAVRVERAP